jgi:hypothetical protein
MRRVISENAMCRGLARMDEEQSRKWLRPALMRSVRDALDRPWILDIDATIKTLFGHQEGATLGYNPHKPGRPSHALHTYWVGNLRLVLDVQVSSGKQHSRSLIISSHRLRNGKLIGDTSPANSPKLLLALSRERIRQTCHAGPMRIHCICDIENSVLVVLIRSVLQQSSDQI